MPTQTKIFDHWAETLDVYEQECFACGRWARLERCHIIPSSFDGNNDVSNLHLLCSGCHKESEGVKTYDHWFTYKRKHDWDYPMNHMVRHLEKFGYPVSRWIEIGQSYNNDVPKTVKHIMDAVFWRL